MWILPLFFLAWLTESKSSGIVTTADVATGCDWETSPAVLAQWGCQSDTWNASNDFGFARGFCQDAGKFNTGKFMWWTGKPKPPPRDVYSFRTGNGDPLKDPKSYVPDRYVSIYVKVLKFNQMYKGLLMFAKGGVNKTKIGDWDMPWEASPQFATYPTILCPRSVMHYNAEDKPYVTKFNFLAPPAGTGTITIKAMLKTGPPNPTDFGDFLILPEITLTEQIADDTRKWVLLPNGTSCKDYCGARGTETCNPAALSTTLDGIQPNPLDSIYPCHGAIFHDCSGNPRVELPEKYCTYAPPSCPTSAAQCELASNGNTPLFCICGAPITGSPTAAPTVPGTKPPPQLGASSHLAPSLGALLGLFSMGAWSSKSQFFWVFAALFFVAAPLASAHNWMEGTRGRASNLGANQFCSPAFPQVTRQKVHMQVALDQDFIVEWASAHGDSTYWIIIHDDARANVSKLTRSLMDNWLNNCPGGGLANTTATGMKYHRFRPNKDLKSQSPVNGASASAVTYADSFYPDPIWNGSVWDSFSLGGNGANGRPTTFYYSSPGMVTCNKANDAEHIYPFNCSLYPKTMLAQYRESHLTSDRRCTYTNASNPWIHTIHRYGHKDVSDGYATALMRVPSSAGKGPGRYQLHYKWSSYCDTIDIDVKAKGMTVTEPYGKLINATDIKYDIAHHCWFEKPARVGQCVEVVTTPQQCEALCNTDGNCKGFQLLPLQLDNSQGESFGLFPESSFIPWNTNLSNTNSFCHKAQFAKAPKAGSMACFTITAFQNDFNSARPLWSFTDDTNHQGFYGTCYIKPTLRDFGTITQVAADTHTETRFLSKCIPCDNIGQDLTNPRWGPQQNYCTDCSKTNTPPRQLPPVPTWTVVAPGTFNETTYWLSPAGSPYAFEDECKILAARDPRCSKYVMYSDYRAKRFSGDVATIRPTDNAVGSFRLVNTTGSWHYSYNLDNVSPYFRTCGCLDVALGNTQPIIDSSMSAQACTNITQAMCVFRNFTIYKLP